MKVKEYINQYRHDFLHFLIFPICIIYFEVLMRIFTRTNLLLQISIPILFSLSLGFFIHCFTYLKKEKIVIPIGLFITSLFYIVECLTRRTFQIYMTLSSIFSGAEDVGAQYSGELIQVLISSIFIIVLFLIPTILYVFFNKKLKERTIEFKPMIIINATLSICLFFTGVLVAQTGSSSKLYTSQYEFNKACETFGLMTALRLDATRSKSTNTLSVEEIEPEEEVVEEIVYGKNEIKIDFDTLIQNDDATYKPIDEYVSKLQSSSKNEYTGIFEGKNLILICAEAFSPYVISEELTPTLYRMMHNGIEFTDYYQPAWGGSTSTGEFSMLMGIVPSNGVSSMLNTMDENNYFTMGNQMQRLGYYTGCYHNGSRTFYNRDLTHENLGYNYYIALGNGLENMTENTYVSDTDLLCNTFDTYKDYQPFCMYYMTIDGHSDYNAPGVWKVVNNQEKVRSVIGDQYSSYVFNYYCYQMELENALTKLISKLEEEGIAQDTVIALTSDHYPYGLAMGHSGNAQDYISELYGHSCAGHLNLDKNAWLLWSGCLEEGGEYANLQCKVTTPTYSLDILPTLSNLFGLEYDSRFLIGRDVFSDQVPQVVWIDYSWKSDKGYYEAGSQTFTPTNPNENVSQDYIDTMSKIAENKINFSNQILIYDYYKHVFGEDTIKDSTELWKQKYHKE